MDNKFSSFKSICRIIAVVFAIIAFCMMFLPQIFQFTPASALKDFDERVVMAKLPFYEVFFGYEVQYAALWFGFAAYIFMFLAAVFGLVLVIFPDIIPDSKLEKIISLAIAGVMVVCVTIILLEKVFFVSMNGVKWNYFGLGAAPIIAGVFGGLAAILEGVGVLVKIK